MTLLELLGLMRRHLKLVILLPLLCAVATVAVSYGLLANTYTASTSLYVLSQSSDDDTTSLQSTLSASQLIANDVATLIESDRVCNDVAQELGLEDLGDFDVSVSNDTSTRVITLSVTGENAEETAEVANAMAADVSAVAQEVMDVKSVNVIDQAQAPTAPSGPNRPLYVAVALLAGLFLAVAIVVLQSMLNTRVSSAEEVEELLGLPVIGQFPAVRKG